MKENLMELFYLLLLIFTTISFFNYLTLPILLLAFGMLALALTPDYNKIQIKRYASLAALIISVISLFLKWAVAIWIGASSEEE